MMRRILMAATGIAGLFALLRERERREGAERLAAALLESLLRAIDANDEETGAHVRRVAATALALADALHVDEHTRRSIERVALFHDIGKIHEALFDLVHEPSSLSPAERRIVATHPARGAAVIAPLQAFYPDLAEGILAHHERWDGTGYPRGLRGRQIPLEARIVSIADAYDAVSRGRRYSGAKGARAAAEAIAAGRGRQFDPALVDLLLSRPVLRAVADALREVEPPPRRGTSARRPPTLPQTLPTPDVTFRWRTLTSLDAPRRRGRHERTARR